jgi:hypothetical protein
LLFRRKNILLRLLGEKARDPRPLISAETGIGLIWSAKSACTTSVIWFFAVSGHLGRATEFDPWPHEYRDHVLRHSPDYLRSLAAVRRAELRWVRVIRDPYKRAVSSYRHALRHGYADAEIAQRLGRPVDGRGFSFAEFLSYLETLDLTACDPHHLLQRHQLEDWVEPTRVINADKEPLLEALLAVEDPGAAARIKIQEAIAAIPPEHRARRVNGHGDYQERIFTRADTAGEWPDYPAFLTPKTTERIAALYRTDLLAYSAYL